MVVLKERNTEVCLFQRGDYYCIFLQYMVIYIQMLLYLRVPINHSMQFLKVLLSSFS